jgi:hypothetical protein
MEPGVPAVCKPDDIEGDLRNVDMEGLVAERRLLFDTFNREPELTDK